MFPIFFFHSELLICHELKPCYRGQGLVKTSLRRLWIIDGDRGLLLRARRVIRNLDVFAGPGLALGGLPLVWL